MAVGMNGRLTPWVGRRVVECRADRDWRGGTGCLRMDQVILPLLLVTNMTAEIGLLWVVHRIIGFRWQTLPGLKVPQSGTGGEERTGTKGEAPTPEQDRGAISPDRW